MTLHDVWLKLAQNLARHELEYLCLDFNETCGTRNAQVWCGNLKVALYDHHKSDWVWICSSNDLTKCNKKAGPLNNIKLYRGNQYPFDETIAKCFDMYPNFP